MYELKHLSRVFKSSEEIPFNDSSRIILMSDCHRGDGGWADDFAKNQNLYYAAMTYYYRNNFTYIEIGDGDELWKNNSLSDIMLVHNDAFILLSKFLKEGRLFFIYGNHDIVKRDYKSLKNRSYRYLNPHEKYGVSLFSNVKFHEGLILKNTDTDDRIFLVHGHQADFLNDRMWKISRFLVRHVWKPLEIFGVNDPTSTAKNFKKKASVERTLTDWVIREKQILIAGHTHRPSFPAVGEPPYFNDGSCVHLLSISGIEIVDGFISLVKWITKAKSDGTLYVGRDVIAGPTKLSEYFNKL